MSHPIRITLTTLVIFVVAGGFLGFTKPGPQLLRQMNLMSACGSSDGC